MKIFPKDWVPYKDGRGQESLLPPRLRVCECAACGAVCCRESIMLSVPRLVNARAMDWIRILAGRILSRPYCERCHPKNRSVIS